MRISNLILLSLVMILAIAASPLCAQALSGTRTIGAGGDYVTFSAAINALNTHGVGTGGVTFNVSAGSVFAENIPVITASGSAADPVIFQKSGTGNNPKITPSGTAGNIDAGIVIHGGDYITFDGIDINSSAVAAVEYGFLIRNASSTNGAQHITIMNSNISMNTAYKLVTLYCSAILQSSDPLVGGSAATAASGANSYNRNNCKVGDDSAALSALPANQTDTFRSGTSTLRSRFCSSYAYKPFCRQDTDLTSL